MCYVKSSLFQSWISKKERVIKVILRIIPRCDLQAQTSMQGALHVTHPDLNTPWNSGNTVDPRYLSYTFFIGNPPKKQQHSNSLYTAKVAAHGVAAR